MKGGAWWATVHGVAKSQTRLTSLSLSQCLFVGCQTRLLVLKTPEFFDGCQEMNFFLIGVYLVYSIVLFSGVE